MYQGCFTMSFKLNTSMTCALSAIFFAFVTPALAGTGPVIVTAPSHDNRSTRLVRFGDLDLALVRDQKRLDRRVAGAIKDVCGLGEFHAVRSITALAPYHECSKEAWTGARAAMKSAIALAQAGVGAGGVQMADKSITVWTRTQD
jgi:UrcA family protein